MIKVSCSYSVARLWVLDRCELYLRAAVTANAAIEEDTHILADLLVNPLFSLQQRDSAVLPAHGYPAAYLLDLAQCYTPY
jgi:hypothetical protein